MTAAFLIIGHAVIAQGPFTIGTIHPGDSIFIIYDVQIDVGATGSVTNQGTVSGSNFANVLTDDPDVNPGTADATVTPLNMFPLPAVFGEFKAYQKNADIELAWKILTEYNTLKYEVEKSPDGRAFVKIGDVLARGGSGINNYTMLDVSPFIGNNFYRLKVIDRDGGSKYSSIVRVVIGGKEMWSLYPNPVSDKMVNVELRNVPKGKYAVTVFSVLGQKVYSATIEHNGGSGSQVILLPASVSKGLYQVQIKGGNVNINKKMVID